MHTVTLKSNSAKYSKKNFNVELNQFQDIEK